MGPLAAAGHGRFGLVRVKQQLPSGGYDICHHADREAAKPVRRKDVEGAAEQLARHRHRRDLPATGA
jgi:hypothetical protein